LRYHVSLIFLCITVLIPASAVWADDGQWLGEIRADYRYFHHPAATQALPPPVSRPIIIGMPGQSDPSAALQLEYRTTIGADTDFKFKGFMRYDPMDSARSHADIRELVWKNKVNIAGRSWDLSIGVDKVFWGVAESNHLADVINQIDLIENIDETEKLGQPVLRLTTGHDWGTVDLFLLPYFRERTFAGPDGRLRPVIPRTETPVRYATRLRQFMPDAAVRWSTNFSQGDVGVYFFGGTNREPRITQDSRVMTANNPLGLVQNYDRMRQVGMDGNLLFGDWIVKGEAIVRHTAYGHFHASVTGVEYSFGSMLGSSWDLNLFFERSLDSRGATALLQNDNFIGARLSLNDAQSTQVKLGLMHDRSDGSRSLRLESTRRITDQVALRLEGQYFKKIAPNNLLHFIRADSYTQLSLMYFF
jgi:hypothetical protein